MTISDAKEYWKIFRTSIIQERKERVMYEEFSKMRKDPKKPSFEEILKQEESKLSKDLNKPPKVVKSTEDSVVIDNATVPVSAPTLKQLKTQYWNRNNDKKE